MPSVTFKGNGDFEDAYEPVPGKSEWGMDTLTRVMRGKQTSLTSFINGLTQGDTYSYNGSTFYLQSWECDNNLVFPGVTLNYKGLIDGIPSPRVTGSQNEQTFSNSCSDPEDATQDIRYLARNSVYRYIATSRPTAPTYTTLDVDVDPIILQTVIRSSDGKVYFGAAPAGVVTALTPAETTIALVECEPVVGSIYFECTDTVQQLLE